MHAQKVEPFYQSAQFSVSPDQVMESPYCAEASSPSEMLSNYPLQEGGATQERRWKLHTDLSGFPAFHSGFPLMDAVYNLSLEELVAI